MKIPVRPELPTAALRSSQATHAAVDNSAPLPTHPESTYKSGKVVQTNATTSEQIALAAAKAAGTVYTAMRSKRVKDDADNVSVVQQPKRLKAWFWAVDGGKVCVAVKYGNKVVELAKGRTAVETTAAELTATLAVLRKAVESGEIDAQIEAVSSVVRRGFKR